MSLPPKAVPKSAAAVVTGPGTGQSPSSQLRATLTSVSLPPGAPVAPQQIAVPPPPVLHNTQLSRITRVQPSLEDRIFNPQPGVTAVYSVPRHTGSPYATHDISKGHHSLAGTPPGHASSPGLSQVSVATAHPCRFRKGWETAAGSLYASGQNAVSAPLVYSTQAQPMNTQPQSRPFVTGPRPTHHQFFQRTPMQAARAAIPSNNPSIRPGSQAPTAAVYPPNQPIMMAMAPMAFPSAQAAQYYIPQYRHSAPYVGPPQQYSVQAPGPGTFYPGHSPGEFPTPYATPQYYTGQPVYPPSPPIIVPTPQPPPPPPAKREKKPIRIRDPNQGGRDITEEIMAGGGTGSRNSTPPAVRPSTPTPPQSLQLSGHAPDHSHTLYRVDTPTPPPADSEPGPDDKPKAESAVPESSPAACPQLADPGVPAPDPSPGEPAEVLPSGPAPPPSAAPPPLVSPVALATSEESEPAQTPAPAPAPAEDPEPAWPPLTPPQPSAQDSARPRPEPDPSPAPSLGAVNGLADGEEADSLGSDPGRADTPPDEPARPTPSSPPLDPCPSADPQELVSTPTRDGSPTAPPVEDVSAAAPVAPPLASAPPAVPAPPPGLQLPVQPAGEPEGARTPCLGADAKERLHQAEGELQATANEQAEAQRPANSILIPSTVAHAAGDAPKTWPKPNEESAEEEVLEEEREVEPREEEEEEAVGASEEEPEHGVTPPLEAEQPLVPEENGEAELELEAELEAEPEPVRNGAGNASETESSDSGMTAGERESSAETAPFLLQEESAEETYRKRQYNRDFLLGFQFMPACMQKPEGLPPISDVVLDKINQNKLPSRVTEPRVISRGPDFTPAFADFGRQMSGGRGAALMSVGSRRVPPRKIIMNVSVNDEVRLKKAEHAWKPGLKREAPADDPGTQSTQDLFRKVRSILNKLTPQMFQQLMKQVTDLTIDTEERLKGVIDLVFEKAIDEPSFSVAYSNMCRCLATLKVPMADKPNTTVNFRKLLLNRCQKEFERDKVDDVVFERKQRELDAAGSSSERERLQQELKEAKDMARRRSIGNIKFIGELFKLKMLTEAIMHDCVVKLLKNHDEESLECLCRLLTTIGKDLDFQKAKPRMDQYFTQMEKIVKERKTSSRIRFMLQDVIDLRLHNWVSRRADQGPKTIEQIHKEAKIEEQEEQRKVHQQLLCKDNKRRPDQREPREQREQRAQREETWSTVPTTKNSRTIDPTKIPRISKPTIDDKIQLGPRAQINWVKGSSGGAKASDADLSRAGGSSLNRFSALQSSSPQVAAPPPLLTPDLESRRTPLGSRSSTGRERNDRLTSSAPSRPGPFTRGGTKELLDSPSPRQSPEKLLRDAADTAPSHAEPEIGKDRDSAVKAETPDRPTLSEEEMERKSKSIIDEFLHINDFKEAVQCVEELDQVSQLHVFVRMGVESTLERSQITRDHIGQLLFLLLQSHVLPKAQFFRGFSETLELADDMAIDIPHIWLYLAELVTPVLKGGGVSLRELFSEFSKPLLPVGRAGILFSEILHLLCKQMSHRKVGALWAESCLTWEALLAEEEDVDTFISEQRLEFTVPGCSSPSADPSLQTQALCPEELGQRLERLLLEDVAGDEHIFDWVEANLDECQMSSAPFLRALMTTVCKAAVKGDSASYRVETATIQRRLPVLLKYLNSDTERQLQALYALQALIVSLDQPPNLLRMFFDCLYDEDVISEDAFYKWESSKDPAEQQGKGVALKSVTAFFTWLREAEEESEDN
ncbi:hypothetical protein AAFF_G00096050 [Aldrovandia affinis]|uniref:Eukaryotic translation initiation factor 4 gamma 3 n=1 Tax=Aldrovandia affinis TaxID=143900 RepID=A0AAD7RY66_9TELE|nr:hypothetical protein AAFF_G00096050 [Aldrovandia affinis]